MFDINLQSEFLTDFRLLRVDLHLYDFNVFTLVSNSYLSYSCFSFDS